jgi:DNA-binding transcriptional regulator GbsR (MarR family)
MKKTDSLFQNGIAYYRFQKNLIKKLSPEGVVMLMHLMDLEQILKPGFYQTHKQLNEALGWKRSKIDNAIKELSQLNFILTEKKLNNKTHFYIIEDRILDVIESVNQSAKIKRTSSLKSSRQRQEYTKTTYEQMNKLTACVREDVSQTLNSDSELYAIDELLKDNLPNHGQA